MAEPALRLYNADPEPKLDLYHQVDGFSELVQAALSSGTVTLDVLSNEFALIPELVLDWASGRDLPHPHVQKKILSFLEKRRRRI